MIKYKKFIVPVFVALGVLGGFLYWKFVGCTSGTCPIFSQWHLTTIYGGLVGYVVGDFAKGLLLKNTKKDEQV